MLESGYSPGIYKMIFSVKNEYLGIGNTIITRIIVELLSLGEYAGIWLFAQANIAWALHQSEM